MRLFSSTSIQSCLALMVIFVVPAQVAAAPSDIQTTKTKLLSQKQFTQHFIKKIRNHSVVLSIKVQDETNILVKYSNKVEARIYLGNAYRRYTQKPSALKQIMTDFSATIITLGQNKDSKILNTKIIVPIIRHKDYVKNSSRSFTKNTAGRPANGMLFKPLIGNILILYALDTKTNYQYLTKNDLKKYRTNIASIHQHAIANLNRLTPTIKLLAPGAYAVKYDNNLDASFLLHNKLWNSKQFKIKGKLLVYVAARNKLIVTGTRDIKNQVIFQKWINASRRQTSYFISGSPITRSSGKWKNYQYPKLK